MNTLLLAFSSSVQLCIKLSNRKSISLEKKVNKYGRLPGNTHEKKRNDI